jgi:hypothetical protein
MAHFAQIDENNIVVQVIVGVDEPLDGETIYHEATGQTWKKTSYNTYGGTHKTGGVPFRKNYAGVGYVYNATLDAFIPPQPYPSWILNEETCLWNAPIAYPEDGNRYLWDEALKQWKILDISN